MRGTGLKWTPIVGSTGLEQQQVPRCVRFLSLLSAPFLFPLSSLRLSHFLRNIPCSVSLCIIHSSRPSLFLTVSVPPTGASTLFTRAETNTGTQPTRRWHHGHHKGPCSPINPNYSYQWRRLAAVTRRKVRPVHKFRRAGRTEFSMQFE